MLLNVDLLLVGQLLQSLAILVTSLNFVDLDEALVNLVLAPEDFLRVVLNIWLVLFVKFTIIAGAVIEVTGLAHEHRAEIIANILLSSTQQRQRSKSKQAHPAHKLNQVKFLVHGDFRLGEHPMVKRSSASVLANPLLLRYHLGAIHVPLKLVFVEACPHCLVVCVLLNLLGGGLALDEAEEREEHFCFVSESNVWSHKEQSKIAHGIKQATDVTQPLQDVVC